MSRTCPAILADVETARRCFRMLKAAGVGAFAEYEEARVVAAPQAAVPLLR
jgi:hypothetical protein